MNRFSRPWWITLAFSSVTVATVGYLVLGQLTDWTPTVRIFAVLGLTTVVDFTTAKWMESIAPTRVDIGPGEKALITDESAEIGRVVSGFEATRQGMVLIRGEIWRARQKEIDPDPLRIGNPVRVHGRSGLTLIVSSARD
jgi:membrane protein implicated in regulation of membrane protease activity